jgi:hypothetical protein
MEWSNKMGRMSDLAIQIEELYSEGLTATEISETLDIPISWVYDALEGFENEDFNDPMDGDFNSAMASAGFGTDEDYSMH